MGSLQSTTTANIQVRLPNGVRAQESQSFGASARVLVVTASGADPASTLAVLNSFVASLQAEIDALK